ncbi:MAG: CDP-glycerol glycerophosphotransferase family protein [Actinomycetes bacterium]
MSVLTNLRPTLRRSSGVSDQDPLALILVALAVPCAWLGWSWPTVVLLCGSALASAHSTPDIGRIRTTTPGAQIRLALILGGFGLPLLTALRMMVLLACLRQWNDPAAWIPIILAGMIIALIMIPACIGASALGSRLTQTVLSRNLAISRVPTPTPLAGVLASGWLLALPEAFVFLFVAIAAGNAGATWAIGAIGVLLAALLTAATGWMIKTVGNPFRAAILRSVRQAITDLHPQVCLYVSGTDVASLYQIRGWLATMERVREPAIILMRSHEQFEELGPTTIPTVSMPMTNDFVSMDLSSLRAGLYLANTGDIIHLVREPSAMSAFIGHGDSDKASSFNPYSKVYDQLWLAGEAGANRYRRANIGVHEDQFVYVGRPQLDAIETRDAGRRSDHVPTILYAPTWEGVATEQQYTSLLGESVALIEAILASTTPVRVVYKPHPYTGRRLPQARNVHRRIVALLDTANERSGHAKQPSQKLPSAQRAELASRSAIAAADALAEFSERFWNELDPHAHVVIEGGDLDLYACFNAADVLVTDVSSVISDFMASDKPFAVFNTSSADEPGFRRRFPSTRAGIVISPSGEEFAEIIGVALGQWPDDYAHIRAALRQELLGPLTPTATARFVDAVTDLVVAASARNDQRRTELQ